ncbi:unnamed protein product [Rotaria magnacalcarata]
MGRRTESKYFIITNTIIRRNQIFQAWKKQTDDTDSLFVVNTKTLILYLLSYYVTLFIVMRTHCVRMSRRS